MSSKWGVWGINAGERVTLEQGLMERKTPQMSTLSSVTSWGFEKSLYLPSLNFLRFGLVFLLFSPILMGKIYCNISSYFGRNWGWVLRVFNTKGQSIHLINIFIHQCPKPETVTKNDSSSEERWAINKCFGSMRNEAENARKYLCGKLQLHMTECFENNHKVYQWRWKWYHILVIGLLLSSPGVHDSWTLLSSWSVNSKSKGGFGTSVDQTHTSQSTIWPWGSPWLVLLIHRGDS